MRGVVFRSWLVGRSIVFRLYTQIPSHSHPPKKNARTHLHRPLLDLDERLRDELGQDLGVVLRVRDGRRLADGVRSELWGGCFMLKKEGRLSSHVTSIHPFSWVGCYMLKKEGESCLCH